MRKWRKLHPGYNYATAQASRKKRREKLGEEAWKELKRAEYQKYRERILKSERARRAKIDPVTAKEYRKNYWQKYKARNHERILADRRDYYARTREHTVARKRKWKLANPELARKIWCKATALRRARKRATTVGDLRDIQKVYDRCQWWRKWFDVAVDHIIPLSKGGTHEAKNLQIIYSFENNKKHARSDYKPRVVFV